MTNNYMTNNCSPSGHPTQPSAGQSCPGSSLPGDIPPLSFAYHCHTFPEPEQQ